MLLQIKSKNLRKTWKAVLEAEPVVNVILAILVK